MSFCYFASLFPIPPAPSLALLNTSMYCIHFFFDSFFGRLCVCNPNVCLCVSMSMSMFFPTSGKYLILSHDFRLWMVYIRFLSCCFLFIIFFVVAFYFLCTVLSTLHTHTHFWCYMVFYPYLFLSLSPSHALQFIFFFFTFLFNFHHFWSSIVCDEFSTWCVEERKKR